MKAQQTMVDMIANNIANVNTEGYTRQRANFTSAGPTLLADGFSLGGGVNVYDVVDRSYFVVSEPALRRLMEVLAS